jgi:hypothetical protein
MMLSQSEFTACRSITETFALSSGMRVNCALSLAFHYKIANRVSRSIDIAAEAVNVSGISEVSRIARAFLRKATKSRQRNF